MVGCRMKYYKLIALVLTFVIIGSGCVYYNTFYYAKKNFNDAEERREKAGKETAAAGSATGYKAAIEKSLIVITDHPESKYVDDALYIIGKSYYHLEDFGKAERKFRELLAAYPESDYSERALFYLGKCRLKMEEYILARQAFVAVDSMTKNDKWKAEAQYMIGEIEFDEGNYEEAIKYYTNYLDKYAGAESSAEVQLKIAQAEDSLGNYEASKNAYLSVAKYNPPDSLYYQTQFAGGEAYYHLGMIDSGYAIFEKLANDEKFYNNAGMIRLKLAEALVMKENYENAIEEYQKICTEFARSDAAARSYFQLGEIYMHQFDDLAQAKTMYDSAQMAYRRSEIYNEALQRSADISKLGQYRDAVTGEDLELAAMSQYQLAELYLVQLENPDTAMAQFQYVIDSFPESEYAARAYMAEGFIYEEYRSQPDSAHDSYMNVLDNFPSSDIVEQAAEALDIDLDTMDIDFPGKRYRLGEKLLFEEENADSAITVFQSILNDFPKSKYAPKAGYAKLWAMEKYHPPTDWNPEDSAFIPDSSLLLAYQEFADSFPNTPYGDSALVKLGKKVTKKAVKTPQPKDQQNQPKDQAPGREDTASNYAYGADGAGSGIDGQDDFLNDSTRYLIALQSYIDSLIDTLHVVDGEPTVTGEFVYPSQAYYTKFEGYVGFMVKVDFIGKPADFRIIQSSGNRDIDEAAIEALRYTEFNVGEMDITYVDQWQFYLVRVELPLEIKGRQ